MGLALYWAAGRFTVCDQAPTHCGWGLVISVPFLYYIGKRRGILWKEYYAAFWLLFCPWLWLGVEEMLIIPRRKEEGEQQRRKKRLPLLRHRSIHIRRRPRPSKSETTPPPTTVKEKTILYTDEKVVIRFDQCRTSKNSLSDYEIVFEVENKIDATLTFQVESIALDGISIPSASIIMSDEVAPGEVKGAYIYVYMMNQFRWSLT